MEVIGLNVADHTVKSEDLEATKERTSNEKGCIALLVYESPCRWYMLRAPHIWHNGEKEVCSFSLVLRDSSENAYPRIVLLSSTSLP